MLGVLGFDFDFGALFAIFVVLWIVGWGTYHLVRAVLKRVRRRRAGGLGFQVGASDQDVRRGDEVEAVITISSSGELGNVEVGLVCTEYYDEEEAGTGGRIRRGAKTRATGAACVPSTRAASPAGPERAAMRHL